MILLRALLTAITWLALGSVARGAVDPEIEAVVQQCFTRSCTACHGPQVPKPKAQFGYVTDLARIAANPDLIVPGHPEQSTLYQLITATDPDNLMPPPRSDEQPFSPAEVMAVKTWILQLASAPAATPAPVPRPTPEAAPVKKGFDARITFGHLHPLVIHFPIALLLVGALVEVIAIIRRKSSWETVRWFLLLGAGGSLFAVATGLVDAGVEGYSDFAVSFHRNIGITVASCATVSAVCYTIAQRTGNRRLLWIARLLLFAAAGLVAVSGHSGGELVYGEGYTI